MTTAQPETLQALKDEDPEIFTAVRDELRRQRDGLELIASENYASRAVLEAAGSVLTNKYAEGYPGRRYYGGCEHVDVAETLAIDRAKKLFGAEHANVQPHSGTQANLTVYTAFLEPGDTILGLDLAHGGHLSHGHPLNLSGRLYRVISMHVRKDDELLDYEEAEALVSEHRPKLIVGGASNYSRTWDWERLRKMADSCGAKLLCDIAHYAGLVAAKLYPSPVPVADAVTTTTHKTLRGPRGGLILSREDHRKEINKLLFPGNQGGPLMHVIAAKAVCFLEALRPDFADYQKQVIANARAMANALTDRGLRIVAGGTDCHLFSVDLRPKKVTGRDAENALGKAGITVNKNAIPFDPEKPMVASGLRLGTPAVTSRGMKESEMEEIAERIVEALDAADDDGSLRKIREKVETLTARFPLYPELG